MHINKENYLRLKSEADARSATLVAVSKIKPPEAIMALYELGQRDFGENYVQELVDKQAKLPTDIRWHFIGHLQSNKVKYIAPFVHLIHGIDSIKLLKEVNKQALKQNRVINVLLQVHIAKEETKFGFDAAELQETDLATEMNTLSNVAIKGLMGMASFSDDLSLVRAEMSGLKQLYDSLKRTGLGERFSILSMGMSGDYAIALEEGSTMLRIGSSIFGRR